MRISSIRRSSSPIRCSGRVASLAPFRANSVARSSDPASAASVRVWGAPGNIVPLTLGQSGLDGFVRRKYAVQAGDLEYLLDEACLAADPELSALILQRLADSHKGPESHAADVGEVA